MTEAVLSHRELEELAAYIDGRLSGDRKDRVEARLASDEDYYDVFLETVRSRQEEDGEGEVVVVPASRWRRGWRFVLPLVAAAALAVVLWPPGAPSLDEWVRVVDAEAVVAADGWSTPVWGERGVGSRGREAALAARLGARSADLRVAVEGGQGPAASAIAAEIRELAARSELFPVARSYAELEEKLDGGVGPEVSSLVLAAQKRLVASYDPESSEALHWRLGAWAESGRLAARAGDRKAVARLLRTAPEADVIPPLHEKVRALLEDPGPVDRDALAAPFAEVLTSLVR